jgi:hypothetical protein
MTPELSPDAWAQIRYAYEHTERPIGDICIEYGISSGTLRDRMRRWRWNRRRPAISRDGPPPAPAMPRAVTSPPHRFAGEGPAHAAAIEQPPRTAAPWEMETETMTLSPTLPLSGGGSESAADAEAGDDAAIVPRLRSAVARVLPAIEATIARLAAGPQHPREMEQAGRALSALTRTLRELNALLSAHDVRTAEDDPVPEDMDDFRMEVARRIQAFLASRADKEDGEATGEETC